MSLETLISTMFILSIGHHKKNTRTTHVSRPAGACRTLSMANDRLSKRRSRDSGKLRAQPYELI
jgi:hypothetical protein